MACEGTSILLVGSGAVGGYYGGRLSQAGAQISVLCRSDYDVVSKGGITVSSVAGDFHFNPAEVIRDIAHYRDEPDYIIVALKVLPEIDLPAMLKGIPGPSTSIVLLQNGIDIEGPVVSAFPANEIISALAFICAARPRYGHVDHQDFGTIAIGTYPAGVSKQVTRLADLFTRTVVPCQVEEDILAARWKKLLWNAPLNPISVLTGGADTREMTGALPTRALVREVMEEVVILSEKAGHPIPRAQIDRSINNTIAMKPFKTSMLQDFEERRPMEVEAILGNTLRIARNHGISVPRIEALYALLSLVDNKIRKGS